MAAFTKAKFSEFENFDVINEDFEGIILDNIDYDLIYSATAFQWIRSMINTDMLFMPTKALVWIKSMIKTGRL